MSELSISYELTSEQKRISKLISETPQNVLINAVCGAGKTEIVLSEIKKYLNNGKRVGFLVPRIEVAREVHQKLKKFFPKNKISFLFANKKINYADIIVATCHYAPKLVNNLDLVILDEVDAFPLSQLHVLQNICFNLAKEKTIYMSATPPGYLPKNLTSFELNKRFHNKKMPTPNIVKVLSPQKYLWKVLKNNTQPLFVFFPTIFLQEKYYKLFKDDFNIKLVNSKQKNNKEILIEFRQSNKPVIFTTTVLERGVTFNKLNVMVMFSNHELFSTQQLLQISGRVGRSVKNPSGRIDFLCFENSQKLKEVKSIIDEKNSMHSL